MIKPLYEMEYREAAELQLAKGGWARRWPGKPIVVAKPIAPWVLTAPIRTRNKKLTGSEAPDRLILEIALAPPAEGLT